LTCDLVDKHVASHNFRGKGILGEINKIAGAAYVTMHIVKLLNWCLLGLLWMREGKRTNSAQLPIRRPVATRLVMENC